VPRGQQVHQPLPCGFELRGGIDAGDAAQELTGVLVGHAREQIGQLPFR
jgi:hypothetical protein